MLASACRYLGGCASSSGAPLAVRALCSGPYSLNELRDAPGATRPRKRVGRGRGGGKGKTCGRGHKGRRARSGGSVPVGFEGGQTPMVKRLPKRGFSNAKFARPMETINLGELQLLLDKGRLEPEADTGLLTMKHLYDQKVLKNIKHGVKVLADGSEHFKGVPASDSREVFSPLQIEVSQVSAAAVEAIEAAGSTVECKHYNRLALRALLKPEAFDVLPRRARPNPKLMQYYSRDDVRGEYSPIMQRRKMEGAKAVASADE
eukprot:g2184.t1